LDLLSFPTRRSSDLVEMHVGLSDNVEAALCDGLLDRAGDEALQNVALYVLLVSRANDRDGRVPLSEAGHVHGARVLSGHAFELGAHFRSLDLDLDLLARLGNVNHLSLH